MKFIRDIVKENAASQTATNIPSAPLILRHDQRIDTPPRAHQT